MKGGVTGLILVLVVLASGCDQDVSSPISTEDGGNSGARVEPDRAGVLGRINTLAANVGHLHNESQRYIAAAIHLELERTGQLTRESLETVVVRACREWVISVGGRPSVCGIITQRFHEKRAGHSTQVPVRIDTSGPLADPPPPSSEFEDLLNRLEQVLDSVTTAEDFQDETNALLTEAQSTLTDTLELQAFAATIAVADSSAGYWEEEMEPWVNGAAPSCDDPEYSEHPACEVIPEVSTQIPSAPLPSLIGIPDWLCGDRCKRVVGADIGGAVWAAVWNWWEGPAAALPIATVSGATSAAQAAIELWEVLTE